MLKPTRGLDPLEPQVNINLGLLEPEANQSCTRLSQTKGEFASFCSSLTSYGPSGLAAPWVGATVQHESQGGMGAQPEEGLPGECGHRPVTLVMGLYCLSLFSRVESRKKSLSSC